MFDVITLGSATKDVFLVSKRFKIIPSSEFPSGFGECLPLGGKIDVDEIVLTTGGGATNAAATFSNFGFRSATITRIGDDASGRDVLDDLVANDISTQYVRTVKRGMTGYSTLLTAPGGERSVLVHRGVSSDFTSADIPKKLDAKWLYITSLGGNISLIGKVVKQAKRQGLHIAYNPGSHELERGLAALESILREVDILNLNLEEAQQLSGIRTRDVKKLCKKIWRPGLLLVITDGTNGAYACEEGRVVHARTSGAKAISRTGAGDAFGSGLVAARMKDLPAEQALQIATLNAEAVVQKHGAKLGLLKKWPTANQMKTIKIRLLP